MSDPQTVCVVTFWIVLLASAVLVLFICLWAARCQVQRLEKLLVIARDRADKWHRKYLFADADAMNGHQAARVLEQRIAELENQCAGYPKAMEHGRGLLTQAYDDALSYQAQLRDAEQQMDRLTAALDAEAERSEARRQECEELHCVVDELWELLIQCVAVCEARVS